YTGLLEAFGLYFEGSHLFLRDNTNRLLGSYKFDWKEVLSAILGYAVYYGFLHRSERTVHEQIRFRLKSKGLPVSLYDIVKGKVVHRSNQGICREIIKVSTALLKMGVKKGDKVALVGLNSVRYFVLDVAISLVGAVSVPIYYTSAPSEVEDILKDCNAQIFFVGFTKILDRLDEIRTTINVISFCRSPLVGGKTKVLPWDEFLSLGEEEHESFVPIAFSDLATIRYTSGSSGEAKGVCFHHGNIRWLVEAVAQVFPWKMRNKEVSYLSFLPLNHVVEGLIGAYSPFYAPAPLKIYFLEDFRGLQAALPLVRPTVFFSIPRFYEKLWHVLEESRLGKIYLHTSSQLVKNLLQPFLRRVLLTKSGLDRCEQLIVGSAPSNEKLLFSFKELGVEVHDAYGLTEAPLVTINRVGRNHIGTVGQPLPQTQIKEAEDGEILVKGPQVMQGYHTKTTCRLIDGAWLPTGDLGKVGEKGDLIIYGRKKNLIATSYGKKISPYKIESMLKELSGVDQAMLIGELKPYISALVWSGQAEKESGILDSINKGIIEINTKVSHPEQIHRWVILKNDLSIEQGDLTPNFKLKRSNIS
ncbi:AMP-binding protein, partial [Candidatus Bathyarchaeota archaeon]|nr:AMP-binding protein [Candidatus Bathyarchaeota archaeon]